MTPAPQNLARKPVAVTLAARCTVRMADVTPACARAIVRAFTHVNQKYEQLRRMGYPTGTQRPKLCTAWEYKQKGLLQVPRGGAPRLRKILEEHGYEVTWFDKRLVLPAVRFCRPEVPRQAQLEARPNQAPAVHALHRKQQGLLRGGTGVGKTETLLLAAVKAGQPTLVIVWNKDLQKQWFGRIKKYGVVARDELGGLGGIVKKPRHGLIAVAMQQSLMRHHKDWAQRYGTVILDEAQRAPADTYCDIVNRFPGKYRWGATADEKRGDGKECITYDCFGPVVAEIEVKGTTLEPTLHVVNTAYADPKYDEDRQNTALISRLVYDKPRNELIMRHLADALERGRRVLLFTDRVEAALLWVRMVEEMGHNAGPLVGGDEHGELVAATIRGLKSGDCRFAAATSYGDVGLDIPVLDCAFVTCPTGGNLKRMVQQVGRVVRQAPGKTDAEVWYFNDPNVDGLDRKARKAMKRWKRYVLHRLDGTVTAAPSGRRSR